EPLPHLPLAQSTTSHRPERVDRASPAHVLAGPCSGLKDCHCEAPVLSALANANTERIYRPLPRMYWLSRYRLARYSLCAPRLFSRSRHAAQDKLSRRSEAPL